MQMEVPFRAVRLTHTYATVEIRELLYLSEGQCKNIMVKLKDLFGITEALIFSTCNRTEVFYVDERDLSEEIISLLCVAKGLLEVDTYKRYFEVLNEEEEVVRKLFEVSMGLESSVLGDLQISNQIKKAYIWANEQGMAQAYLHRLLHTIFHANKRVHQETPFRDGAASVSYASAELAYNLTQHLTFPKVLVLGIGEMGKDVAFSLDLDHFEQIDLCNRTISKAQALALDCDAGVIPIEKLGEVVSEYDVILSCVSVEEPILRRDMFASKVKPSIVIDLCVPRSVGQEVDELSHVIVYGIDEIQEMTAQALERRKAAIPEVKAIIEEEARGFMKWRTQLSISPTIQRMKEALEDIRKEELARYLKKSNAEESQLVENVTRSIIQKIIKLPVLQLKEACRRGDQDNLIQALHDIFNLERQQEPKS